MDNIHKLEYLQQKADTLKAIAHPIRLCILNCLLETGNCNVTNLSNMLDKPQSTVSQHLSKLRNAGVVFGTRNGVEMNYKITDEQLEILIKLMLKELQ